VDEDALDWTSGLELSTTSALRRAGWYPGRDVDIAAAFVTLEEVGYALSPVAARLLRAISGLKVEPAVVAGPNFSNDEPLLVDPVGVGKRHRDEAVEIGSALGGDWYPLGWWLSYSHVFMESSGAMSAYADGLVWDLGRSPSEGMNLMVSATRPLVCVHASAGVKPWPE
jgi:hypothetical protein